MLQEVLHEARMLVAFFIAAILLVSFELNVAAQDWRSALEAEKARNAEQIATIDQQGDPIADSLRQVNAAVARHNEHQCVARRQGECDWYDDEAEQFNTQQQTLRSQLESLINQRDALVKRNAAIDRQLQARVQLPHACRSNADCEVSGCCGSSDGARGQGNCQPSCR